MVQIHPPQPVLERVFLAGRIGGKLHGDVRGRSSFLARRYAPCTWSRQATPRNYAYTNTPLGLDVVQGEREVPFHGQIAIRTIRHNPIAQRDRAVWEPAGAVANKQPHTGEKFSSGVESGYFLNNQKVGGSNPSIRATGFSSVGRASGYEKTRTVFVPC